MQFHGTATAVLLLVALGLGCEKAENPAPQPDTLALRATVDSAMVDHFRAFERRDDATWSSFLADDAYFTEADPANSFESREAARQKTATGFEQIREMGITIAIRPLEHWTWVAHTGQVAVSIYDLDYDASYQNQSFSYRLRASYFLERDSSGWRARAAQYSRPIAYDTLFMALIRRAVPPPPSVGGSVPPAMEALVQQFRTDIHDIGSAAFAEEVTVVSPGTIVQGAESGRRELVQWMGPVGSATDRGDGLRGGLDRPGTVGWIAANLNVPVFAGPESAQAPMRALFVYRLAGARWEIIHASLSVGQRERME